MSEPDLFVVCKNCSSEVSPYVTECPYCGQRVRKRAPKIEKDGRVEALGTARTAPSLPRLRRGEMPGIAPDTRPYATIALIGLSLVATLVASAGFPLVSLAVVDGPPGEQWWQFLTTPFVHRNLGYQFIVLVAVGVFGMHLERRFGALAPVGIFLAAGAAGAAAGVAAATAGLGSYPIAGGNGAALGLLCAWLVEDRRANRKGDDRGNDLIGVYVFAAVLALLSLADPNASPAAACAGALTGAIIGLAASGLRR